MELSLTLFAWLLATWVQIACPSDMVPVGTFCVDIYEAPNIEGQPPMVMQSALDGQKWCQARGKRLCTEGEWERACAGTEGPCNNVKQWLPWDPDMFEPKANPWPEVKRLWQGGLAGAYPKCRSNAGAYDMRGSVEEWVVSRRGRDWPYTMKGGFWSKNTSCRGSNDAHEPTFRFYETGFRCCLTPY